MSHTVRLMKTMELRELTPETGHEIAAWIGGTFMSRQERIAADYPVPGLGYLRGPVHCDFGQGVPGMDEPSVYIGKVERPGRKTPKIYVITDVLAFCKRKGWGIVTPSIPITDAP